MGSLSNVYPLNEETAYSFDCVYSYNILYYAFFSISLDPIANITKVHKTPDVCILFTQLTQYESLLTHATQRLLL